MGGTVCFSVAFGRNSIVILKGFGLASLPLFWSFCYIDRDLLGFSWPVPVGVSGVLTSTFKPGIYEARSTSRELTSMLFIGS